MIIKAQASHIDFETGKATQVLVSVVGVAPHKTYFVEQAVGFLPAQHASQAPFMVGAFMEREAQAENLTLPAIPGVTVPGHWVNPKPAQNKEST